MNNKAAAIIATLSAERETLTNRMEELDAIFLAGNGSDEMEAEFYAADSRVRELGRLIHEAGQPNRKICPNTQALVSANID